MDWLIAIFLCINNDQIWLAVTGEMDQRKFHKPDLIELKIKKIVLNIVS